MAGLATTCVAQSLRVEYHAFRKTRTTPNKHKKLLPHLPPPSVEGWMKIEKKGVMGREAHIAAGAETHERA